MSLTRCARTIVPLFAFLSVQASLALAQNTSQLSENGWYADDMRADGFGTQTLGTNLVSPTLTDAPESISLGNAAHDTDIQRQILFGAAPAGAPAGTNRGAVQLIIGPGATTARSQLSHRKNDGTGHSTGLAAFGPGTTMQYSWLGTGNVSVTPAIKFGVQTADFATIWISQRTGENAWDKLMVYEPAVGNGGSADGLWHTENASFTTGKWWLFDRTQVSGSSATPLTLEQMSTSTTIVGSLTIAEIYAKMIAPGAIVSSVQVGVGPSAASANVYVNQIATNFYRNGRVTTFGAPQNLCDQDLTGSVLFGTGVANGSFTVERNAGVEVALRAKLRFDQNNLEQNVFNSNGDGTYSFETGFPTGAGLPGWVGPTTPRWNIEWAVNSNNDGSTLNNLDALTYEIGVDFDSTAGRHSLVFDPISTNSVVPFEPPVTVGFWNHSFGNNLTAPGAGVTAGDLTSYVNLLSTNNMAQNSWSLETFNLPPFNSFNPWDQGTYDIHLAAFENGVEVARTSITVITQHARSFDQDATSNVIIGGGIGNGGFSETNGLGLELDLRGKLRFNAQDLPENTFNSNGDGTYTFSIGSPAGGAPWVAPSTPLWNLEWSINTDVTSTSGLRIDDYTYEMGMDFDPSHAVNFLTFDPIAANSVIPYNVPTIIPFWDHSFGTSTTGQGAGVQASDQAGYLSLLAAGNLVQNSWNVELFNDAPFDVFDPSAPGHYEFYLAAFKNEVEVARTEMTMVVMNGATLVLEAPVSQTDQNCDLPGTQIQVELHQRNLGTLATGFQGFLSFDAAALQFEGATSSYSAAPYGTHIQPIATAEVLGGELRIDGSVGFGGAGSAADALLATFEFTVADECNPVTLNFDLAQTFGSELSFQGTPITTTVMDSSSIVPDATPPVLADSPNILAAADASVNGGCDSAVITFPTPVAFDHCSAVTVECTPPSGTAFPAGEVTTVTCLATDAAGNTSSKTFTVTIPSTNLFMVDIQLVGVATPTTRCIQFVTDSCASVADISLDFDGTGNFTGLVELPCGTWTSLCVKDQQHTTWDSQPLTLSLDGTLYMSAGQFQLAGGDTDGDGDVDINDVTWLMFQFGGLANDGGCPWDGTRDADFSNNGAVGSEDFTFLTSDWLSVSGCSCSLTFGGNNGISPAGQRARIRTEVRQPWQARLDADGNRIIDYRDVRAFELAHDLPHDLSNAMRVAAPAKRR